MKYLQQKYIDNLDVYDEGDFWQTEDALLLKEKMDFLNEKIIQLEDVLNTIEIDEGSSAESIVVKIEEVLKKTKFRKP